MRAGRQPAETPSRASWEATSKQHGQNERVIATARKTTTSNEVKQRWKNKTYKAYQVNLRKDEDADLIEFVEELRKSDKIGTTDIFRIGIETIKKEGL